MSTLFGIFVYLNKCFCITHSCFGHKDNRYKNIGAFLPRYLGILEGSAAAEIVISVIHYQAVAGIVITGVVIAGIIVSGIIIAGIVIRVVSAISVK